MREPQGHRSSVGLDRNSSGERTGDYSFMGVHQGVPLGVKNWDISGLNLPVLRVPHLHYRSLDGVGCGTKEPKVPKTEGLGS